MQRTFIVASALLLALSACALPDRPVTRRDAASSAADSSATAADAMEAAEFEEAGEGAPATQEATETGALLERRLPTGVLEAGDASAPLTLLVFTEHHCSYCRQFMTELFPRLKTDFIDTGILKMQVAILPLRKYPQSRDAAVGLICSAEQGQGIAMHQILFGNPNRTTDAILSYALSLKLETKVLRECMSGTGAKTLLEAQEAWAQSLNVSVIPTFFLNGEKFIGLPYYPDLKGRIEEARKKIEGER